MLTEQYIRMSYACELIWDCRVCQVYTAVIIIARIDGYPG